MSIAPVGGVGCGLRPERLLYFAQVKPDQSIGEEHCGDSARATQPVYGGFADLQNFGELARGEVVRSLVFGLFRRI